jgi:hypothetical protein
MSIVLMANNFGIAAAIPYLKKFVYSYNTLVSQTRRVHLVWEVDTLSEYHDIKLSYANI